MHIHPWDELEQPWQWTHLNYSDLFMGIMFSIPIDAHSQWMEVEVVNFSTTQAITEY